jgi:HK97 family phage major capsid protein
MNIKQLRQMKADNDAAQAKLKAEGRGLLALAADKRTPEQTARLDAIDAALDELATNAATIAADLARAERFADDERRSGTLDATTIQIGADHAAERPWGPRMPANASADVQREVRLAALGEFAIAVRSAMSGTGFDPRLSAAATGMGTSIPSDGGFAVPLEVAAGIERDMFAGGDLLGRVDARTISGDSIAYNVIDETSRASTRNGGVVGYWVDQGTAATASQPKLARVEMKLRKVGALGYMTDELVSDAAALGGELQSMFTDELVFQVEDAITEGTGAGQPFGYLGSACQVSVAKESGQSAATILNDNLIKMWARLKTSAKKNAVWLINTDSNPQLDVLSQAIGTGGIPSRIVNYDSNGAITIKGRPVIETEYNATLGTVGDIVLIDLKQYRLIRKGGVEQASSIHVRFTQGEQTFRAFYRCDGQMMPRSPLTPFKGSNTVSPVVVLATRS